jgi:hypothetical protein
MRLSERIRLERKTKLIVAMIALLGGIAGGLLSARLTGSDGRALAQTSGFSYELTDLNFVYPYLDPISGETLSDAAGVSFRPEWNSASYPGVARCRITLIADGAVVGSMDFDVSAGQPSHPDQHSGNVPVSVTEPPAEIEANCDPAENLPGEGYSFELLEINSALSPVDNETIPGRAELLFLVRWVDDKRPGLRTCEIIVRRTDGTIRTYGPRNVSIGQAELILPIDVHLSPDVIVDADVQCQSYTGLVPVVGETPLPATGEAPLT